MTTNPYAAPQSDLATDPFLGRVELASRGSRLVAIIIDGLIMGLLGGIIVFLIPGYGYQDFVKIPSAPEALSMVVVSLIIYSLVNGYPLSQTGQTWGKKMMGIRIATREGALPPLVKLLINRYLFKLVVGYIPLGGLINILLIFRGDKRCGHDMIAGTQVVKA